VLQKYMLRYPRTQPFPGAGGPLPIGFRQYDREFVTSETRREIGLPRALPEQRRHLDQRPASARMPMAVVDPLEPVEVDDDQRQRPSGAGRTRHLPAKSIS